MHNDHDLVHNIPQALKAAGLRNTPARREAFRSVIEAGHATYDMVSDHLNDTLSGVSTQTVYNVLTDLTNASLIRKINPSGSKVLYELFPQGYHHHFICNACKRIDDLPCTHLSEYGECSLKENYGPYTIEEAVLTYRGLCPSCTVQRNHQRFQAAKSAAV